MGTETTPAPAFEIRVECTAAPGEHALLAFTLGARRVMVRETIDRWHGADYTYLKLRGEDDATYILRHDARADRWAMILFQTDPQQAMPTGPRDPPQPLLS